MQRAKAEERGAHWAQSKGQFSSLGQKLSFEIWFFDFCHFILTPWGPQILIVRFQKQFEGILQSFKVNLLGKVSIFDFET